MKRLALIAGLFLAGCITQRIHVSEMQGEAFAAVGVLYKNLQSACTVTLIDECVVVTAAHCVDDELPVLRTVSFDQKKHFKVESVVVPDEYYEDSWTHDIALITLEDSPDITPIPFSRAPISMANWGDVVVIVGRSGGDLRWQTRWIAGRQEDTHLIMWADPLHFLVRGDSGGPMLMDGKIVGLSVFTIHDNTVPDADWYLSLSTDVGEYIDWINEQLKPDSGGLPELPVPSVDGSTTPPRTRPDPVRHR